ncbi:MFS transporter [Tomitella fengzijianii]|uniref:MFS transporter n=1 Tax=Tomitella fengzijianii TaxID=2597660 RepID=UPI003558CF34
MRSSPRGPAGGLRGFFSGRVIAFLALTLSALVLRTAVTSITPLLDRIGDEVGFGSAVAGVFGMVPTAMFALFGLLTPLLIGRTGLERVAVLSMVLSGAGLLARALVNDTALLLVFSGVALAGMGIGNVVIPPLVKRYFSDRVAIMSAVYITCVQLGTAVPPLLAVPVADAYGWRWSLGMWALVAAAALLPTLALLRSRRSAEAAARVAVPGASSEDRPAAARPGVVESPVDESAGRRGSLVRTSLAWGLAGMFGMTSLITYSLFTWLPRIFSDAGADEAFGGAMVALFSAMGLIAALAGPTVCARMYNPFPIVLGCAVVYIVGFGGLYFAPMGAPILWVVLLGLGPSTFPMSLTLINLRTRTQSGASRMSGFSQGIGYTAACLGPLLFGVLRDATGGWAWPFAFMLAAMCVMVAGAFFACKPRYLEDLW